MDMTILGAPFGTPNLQMFDDAQRLFARVRGRYARQADGRFARILLTQVIGIPRFFVVRLTVSQALGIKLSESGRGPWVFGFCCLLLRHFIQTTITNNDAGRNKLFMRTAGTDTSTREAVTHRAGALNRLVEITRWAVQAGFIGFPGIEAGGYARSRFTQSPAIAGMIQNDQVWFAWRYPQPAP